MNIDDRNWKNALFGNSEEIVAGKNIIELAKIIQDISGFKGELVFNKEMPDGTPQKVLDTSRINALGWEPKVPLKEGLKKVYPRAKINPIKEGQEKSTSSWKKKKDKN